VRGVSHPELPPHPPSPHAGPQDSVPPQPSPVMPHVMPIPLHDERGTHVGQLVDEVDADVASVRVDVEVEHAPQSSSPPQPSPMGPQVTPASSHVLGKQVPPLASELETVLEVAPEVEVSVATDSENSVADGVGCAEVAADAGVDAV